MSTQLTIGGATFREGDRVKTPRGHGRIIGLDPFANTEIGVQIDGDNLVWFGFRDVEYQGPTLTCEACGQPTHMTSNGIGICCWGKDL